MSLGIPHTRPQPLAVPKLIAGTCTGSSMVPQGDFPVARHMAGSLTGHGVAAGASWSIKSLGGISIGRGSPEAFSWVLRYLQGSVASTGRVLGRGQVYSRRLLKVNLGKELPGMSVAPPPPLPIPPTPIPHIPGPLQLSGFCTGTSMVDRATIKIARKVKEIRPTINIVNMGGGGSRHR